MFWFKKEVEPVEVTPMPPVNPPKPEQRCTNKVIIRTVRGLLFEWTRPDWDPNKPARLNWLRFYKWYFGKTTAHYVMKYKEGETMLRREDIESFTVELIHHR